jgi:hypothetical protein
MQRLVRADEVFLGYFVKAADYRRDRGCGKPDPARATYTGVRAWLYFRPISIR